jgi:lycopene cyclase domain-containing protein
MFYTSASITAVLIAVIVDVFLLRTRLLASKLFWATWVIVLFFQFIVNGVLTGLGVVQYDPGVIVGVRLFFAPIEDIGFGFALITLTLCGWVRLGHRAERRAAD